MAAIYGAVHFYLPCRTCRKGDEKAKEKTSCHKCHHIYFMMFQEVSNYSIYILEISTGK